MSVAEYTKDYYVYAYLDPRREGTWRAKPFTFGLEPFYVGKGRGSRLNSHLAEAYRIIKKTTKKSLSESVNKRKLSKIVAVLKSGGQPVIVKLRSGLSEMEALALEEKIIAGLAGYYCLLNVREIGWLGGEWHERTFMKGGAVKGCVGHNLGLKRYYCETRKQHFYLKPDSLKTMLATGFLKAESLIELGKATTKKPEGYVADKARIGEANGMHGKKAATAGLKWFNVDGVDRMLTLENATTLKNARHVVIPGRKNLLTAQVGSARRDGRRVIFEGELTARYRTSKELEKEKGRKYQYGFIWKPEKPTYVNNRLIN